MIQKLSSLYSGIDNLKLFTPFQLGLVYLASIIAYNVQFDMCWTAGFTLIQQNIPCHLTRKFSAFDCFEFDRHWNNLLVIESNIPHQPRSSPLYSHFDVWSHWVTHRMIVGTLSNAEIQISHMLECMMNPCMDKFDNFCHVHAL